jgi:hypothetical protein
VWQAPGEAQMDSIFSVTIAPAISPSLKLFEHQVISLLYADIANQYAEDRPNFSYLFNDFV